jgi:hypothetical protein
VDKAAKEEIMQGVIQLFWQILQAGIGAQSVRRKNINSSLRVEGQVLKG